MPVPITLRIQASVVRRYEAAVRQLRRHAGVAPPKLEDLIRRELTHRTAAGIVDDFLQSDWPSKSRRREGVQRQEKRQ